MNRSVHGTFHSSHLPKPMWSITSVLRKTDLFSIDSWLTFQDTSKLYPTWLTLCNFMDCFIVICNIYMASLCTLKRSARLKFLSPLQWWENWGLKHNFVFNFSWCHMIGEWIRAPLDVQFINMSFSMPSTTSSLSKWLGSIVWNFLPLATQGDSEGSLLLLCTPFSSQLSFAFFFSDFLVHFKNTLIFPKMMLFSNICVSISSTSALPTVECLPVRSPWHG